MVHKARILCINPLHSPLFLCSRKESNGGQERFGLEGREGRAYLKIFEGLIDDSVLALAFVLFCCVLLFLIDSCCYIGVALMILFLCLFECVWSSVSCVMFYVLSVIFYTRV